MLTLSNEGRPWQKGFIPQCVNIQTEIALEIEGPKKLITRFHSASRHWSGPGPKRELSNMKNSDLSATSFTASFFNKKGNRWGGLLNRTNWMNTFISSFCVCPYPFSCPCPRHPFYNHHCSWSFANMTAQWMEEWECGAGLNCGCSGLNAQNHCHCHRDDTGRHHACFCSRCPHILSGYGLCGSLSRRSIRLHCQTLSNWWARTRRLLVKKGATRQAETRN